MEPALFCTDARYATESESLNSCKPEVNGGPDKKEVDLVRHSLQSCRKTKKSYVYRSVQASTLFSLLR